MVPTHLIPHIKDAVHRVSDPKTGCETRISLTDLAEKSEIVGPRLSTVADTFATAQSRPKTSSARARTREAITDHVNLTSPSRYVSLPETYRLPTATTSLETKGRSQSEESLHVEISDILR